MSAARVALITAVLLVVLRCPATADELNKARSALASLRADLQSGRIAQANIFSIPYTFFTTFSVTPEYLEVHSRNNKIDVVLSAESVKELIKAIDDTQLDLYSDVLDLKWGAVFFDASGTRLHSIYLVGRYEPLGPGRGGNIGGINVKLNGSLIVWFENNFGVR